MYLVAAFSVYSVRYFDSSNVNTDNVFDESKAKKSSCDVEAINITNSNFICTRYTTYLRAFFNASYNINQNQYPWN
ncbi:hypothetical protein KO525_09935 [Psychrosphaera sp. B3R10]|uniref:hypothetical protein n=1 Tax=unclassified Psychrosphaera TaxID=2641570 RepID=UPI001C09FFC0|nr:MULTISPECIES: hypothetical protein [unclassified Psychrosphaera]MBU2883516.1 hypothetical protein [Psychrosphaera sp. I2R16]MBU2989695.1 hypothetical protein [Psychrosphaera sp. B3R10]MDO6719851.1 hypothetical protein [Psychrosphaera sp. 1_MG-2023]